MQILRCLDGQATYVFRLCPKPNELPLNVQLMGLDIPSGILHITQMTTSKLHSLAIETNDIPKFISELQSCYNSLKRMEEKENV